MLCICTGKVVKAPWVVDGQVVVRDVMNVVTTGDHRYGDAALLAMFVNILNDLVSDPEAFNPDKYKDLVPYEELEKLKKQ
jgi:pyruvate/2-oxoglutarate dehydrogenase complex dihydrolipoamide acyltransferase (E2) component